MRKVIMIYPNLYDWDGNNVLIGGVETYLMHLSEVVKAEGFLPIIIQGGNSNFTRKYNDVLVYARKCNKENFRTVLTNYALEISNKNEDILIFGSDYVYTPNNFRKSLIIQHGIAWDLPTDVKDKIFMKKITALKKIKSLLRVLRRTLKNQYYVCVDYNYINWTRTFLNINKKKMWIIPNAVHTSSNPNLPLKKHENKINIVFARRFIWYRGTMLFSEAILKMLQKYENIHITFAGEGPDEELLKKTFKNYKNVEFTKYSYKESVKFHSQFHISVVPSIGSEGTSLSLAEAMASQCAVIATNVGGMTNMVIDRYNGLLINPHVEDLTEALEILIEDKELREKLALNAKNTAYEAFNIEIWQEKWKKVFNYMENL